MEARFVFTNLHNKKLQIPSNSAVKFTYFNKFLSRVIFFCYDSPLALFEM